MVRVGGGAAQVVQRGVRSQTQGIYQLCVCCCCCCFSTNTCSVVTYFRLPWLWLKLLGDGLLKWFNEESVARPKESISYVFVVIALVINLLLL